MKGKRLLGYRLGLLVICLLALALRLHLLEDIFLNEDEEKSQLLYVQSPAAQILWDYEPNNHWLTSGLGHILGQLGRQRFLLRWPSVFFGTLAIPLMSLAGYWLFNSRKIGLLSAFLLALSAFHVYWSQQFRGYSVLLFFTLLSLLLLYRALQTGRRAYWWGFSGGMVLALVSHLYGVLALIITAVVLMKWSWGHYRINGPQQRWAWWVGLAVLVISSNLLWFGKRYVINVYHPPPEGSLFQLIYYQGLAFGPTLPEISDFFKGLALAFTAHPHEGLALALFGGLSLIGWLLCSTRFPQATHFLALWLLLPLGVVIGAEFAVAGFFVLNRFLIFILPAWLLLVVGGLTLGSNRLAAHLARPGQTCLTIHAGLMIIGLSYLSWLNLTASQAYFTDRAANDWRGVAAYLANRLEPTDLIICNRLLYRSPPHPDEDNACVHELELRLAAPVGPTQGPEIVAAGDIQRHFKNPGPTAGTVWVVIWGLDAPLPISTATLFDRLGYTTLLKIDSGPTQAANLVQAVEQLTQLDPPVSPIQRLGVDFGDPPSIRLLGYRLPPSLHAGQTVVITPVWQALAPISTDYTIFLHLRDVAGQTVAQLDFRPFEGAYPTSHWLPGSIIAETRLWQLPPELSSGPYTLHVGLYQAQTLARSPLTANNDSENTVSLGEVWLE